MADADARATRAGALHDTPRHAVSALTACGQRLVRSGVRCYRRGGPVHPRLSHIRCSTRCIARHRASDIVAGQRGFQRRVHGRGRHDTASRCAARAQAVDNCVDGCVSRRPRPAVGGSHAPASGEDRSTVADVNTFVTIWPTVLGNDRARRGGHRRPTGLPAAAAADRPARGHCRHRGPRRLHPQPDRGPVARRAGRHAVRGAR